MTHLRRPIRVVGRSDKGRRTAEPWSKAAKLAAHSKRLWCQQSRANGVRLQQSIRACYQGNLRRHLVMRKGIAIWSLPVVGGQREMPGRGSLTEKRREGCEVLGSVDRIWPFPVKRV